MPIRLLSRRLAIAATLLAGACTSAPPPQPALDPAPWPAGNVAADVALGPGDEVELVFHTAPELNRVASVAQDGTLRLPFIEPVPVAGANLATVRSRLEAAYGSQLVDPSLDVLPVAQKPARIFVGGAVRSPGAFELRGPTDPLQGLILAGGANGEAHLEQVVLMRRNVEGVIETRQIDLKAALADPRAAAWFPLEPFDVLYVPRTRIADQNRFVAQYIRRALPLDFFLVYDLAGDAG